MSTWKDAENGMSDDLTDEFAEPISHQPMHTPPNERPCIDPSRPFQNKNARFPTRPLEGVFNRMAHEVDLSKGHTRSMSVPATRVSSRQPELSIDERDMVSQVNAGDVVAIIERGQLYTVTDVQGDGQGRICLKLTQQGRPQAGF